MKRGLLPGGAIFLGLIISLAALGVGYGLFSDTLRISGAVVTGAVNARFSLHEVDEGLVRGAPHGPSDNSVNEDKEAGGFDIAECYARIRTSLSDGAISAVDTAPDANTDSIAQPPADFLYVLIKNGYPSFNCYVDFDVHNAGSIPIKVTKPVIGPAPSPDILTVELLNCYEGGTQLEPGQEALCTLHVHIERGAHENSVYRFGATICAYQWNAAGPVRCAVPLDIEPLPADLAPEPLAPVSR